MSGTFCCRMAAVYPRAVQTYEPRPGVVFSTTGLPLFPGSEGPGRRSRISFGKQGGEVVLSNEGFHRFHGLIIRPTLRNITSCHAFDDQGGMFDDEDIASQAVELFGDEESQSFVSRLIRVWNILFPSPKRSSTSNAEIAKQRLKMILISDRCAVNDEAKRRIVDNIVGALSSFVEIESQDKVQLTVSSDPDLGTVYSVTVPVRRVRPEYQEYSRELQKLELCEEFRTVDLKLEYQSDVQEGGMTTTGLLSPVFSILKPGWSLMEDGCPV